METYIIKKKNKKELFTIDKIKNAISKAFLAVGAFATEETLGAVLSHLRVHNDVTVEEIQNQVEVALMAEGYYQVAKAYMLYRNRHSEDRETQARLEFLMNYCQASNAAEGSKYDANANVENKNIATLIGELPKQGFIRLNRRLLTEQIKKLKNGEAIEQPTYSYIESNRLKETVHVEPKPVIIIEGIMALHYKKLRDMMDLKIFVDTDSDVRLMRNIRRDVVERGRTVDMVLEHYETAVKPMHEQFIEPTKKFADLIIPSGGDNRTGIHILKTYIEGIVTGV